MKSKERIVSSIEETGVVAAAIAAALTPAIRSQGVLLGMTGDLGAGKTSFSRVLCLSLGVTNPVSSPTFVLEHEYAGNGISIEHWDLYRLRAEFPEELFEPVKPGVLRIIEWIDRSPELIDTAGLLLSFEILGSIQRKIAAQWQQNSAFDTLLDAAL